MTDNLLALAAATAVLVMIPGPNVALIVANSMAFGRRSGLTTVAGTTLGVALQLVVVVAGLAAVMEVVAGALAWIKWLGVAYLIWLGVHTFGQAAAPAEGHSPARSAFWRGALIAGLNPKTLMFNAAFLPQFVVPAAHGAQQMALIALVFLAVLFVGDTLWVLLSDSARGLLRLGSRFQQRLTGGFLVLAGVGLAISRRTG